MTKRDRRLIYLAYFAGAAAFFVAAWLLMCQFLRVMSLGTMAGAMASAISGLGMFLIGILNIRIHPTRSSTYASEELAKLSQAVEPDKQERAEALASQYSRRYCIQMGLNDVGFLMILFTSMIVGLTVGEVSAVSWVFVVVMVVVIALAGAKIRARKFQQFSGILGDECQPYAALIAFLSPFGTRQRFRIDKWMYGYLSMITLCFYYMGEFKRAYHHIGIAWDENLEMQKKTVIQVHFRTLRLYCFRELGMLEEAGAEKARIEECLKQHPKWERYPYAISYRTHEKIRSLMEEGDYQGARQLLLGRIDPAQPLYMRVASHYQLWLAARLMNDPEEAGIHADFITQYGKDMFYYARINSEQQ